MEREKRITDIWNDWEKEAAKLPKETLDKIGELWITKILDCDENTLNTFKGDVINDEIGLKHAGVTNYQADSRGFWTEINKIAPTLAPDTELEYLIENDDAGTAAWAMICTLEGISPIGNSLLTKTINNALLFK